MSILKYKNPETGEWETSAMGGGGGAQPDWNAKEGEAGHILNRTHYEELTELVPLTSFTPTFNSTVQAPMAELNSFDLVEGNTYKVIFDGVEYVCEATSGSMNGMQFVAIGNKYLVSNVNTGEPFGVVKVTGAAVGFVITFDMNAHSVQVFERGKLVQIPPQFLGNAFPYYIEVTGIGTDDDPYVCHDTVANVNAIFASGRPLAIKHTVTDTNNNQGVMHLSFSDRTLTSDGIYVYQFGLWFNSSTITNSKFFQLISQTDGTFSIDRSLGLD